MKDSFAGRDAASHARVIGRECAAVIGSGTPPKTGTGLGSHSATEAERRANRTLSVSQLEGVEAPVHVFQSRQDRNVPPAMGRFMAAGMATATYHECPDEGHLSIVVNRFDDCAGLLLREL